MKPSVTQRTDWPAAIQHTFRFFNLKDYANEKIEPRIVFYLQMLENFDLLCPSTKLADLGAGIYWFDPLVQALGVDIHLVDDFGGGGGVDNLNRSPSATILKRYSEELNIPMHQQDILTGPLPFESGSMDAVTCFHCLEHWHHSPKKLFGEIRRILKPGGLLFLATPNAVNIRKRITVLLGMNNWSPLDEWFDEEPYFRGHVREPILKDLRSICVRNNFKVEAQYGRNFIGGDSQVLARFRRLPVHALANISQLFLQFVPTLCSDLHVVARKL